MPEGEHVLYACRVLCIQMGCVSTQMCVGEHMHTHVQGGDTHHRHVLVSRCADVCSPEQLEVHTTKQAPGMGGVSRPVGPIHVHICTRTPRHKHTLCTCNTFMPTCAQMCTRTCMYGAMLQASLRASLHTCPNTCEQAHTHACTRMHV